MKKKICKDLRKEQVFLADSRIEAEPQLSTSGEKLSNSSCLDKNSKESGVKFRNVLIMSEIKRPLGISALLGLQGAGI